jgi:hypothetical protein
MDDRRACAEVEEEIMDFFRKLGLWFFLPAVGLAMILVGLCTYFINWYDRNFEAMNKYNTEKGKE